MGKCVSRPPASESKTLVELTKKRKIYTDYVISVIENAVKGKKLGKKNKKISPLEQQKLEASIRLGQIKEKFLQKQEKLRE